MWSARMVTWISMLKDEDRGRDGFDRAFFVMENGRNEVINLNNINNVNLTKNMLLFFF